MFFFLNQDHNTHNVLVSIDLSVFSVELKPPFRSLALILHLSLHCVLNVLGDHLRAILFHVSRGRDVYERGLGGKTKEDERKGVGNLVYRGKRGRGRGEWMGFMNNAYITLCVRCGTWRASVNSLPFGRHLHRLLSDGAQFCSLG